MNWERIGRRAAVRPWAARVLSRVEAEYRDTVVDIPGPELPSAWTHHYFCDDDGAPLRFEGDGHACTRCDRRYAGEPWDGAWRTRRHNEAAAQAQRAALLIRLAGEPPGELERILAGYDYLAYAPHGVNAGTGRVQPQSLDEAVWAIGLLRALRWSGIAAPPGMETMATGVVDLLRPQVGGVHNIHCWLLAALAECAALLRDRALLGWCGQRVEEQVLSGFHPEGLWYEVNPHYHYYAVAALLSYREVGPLSARAEERLARAIAAPPLLAYADGRLPAYGDGWAECFVGDFAPQAEAAAGLLDQPVDLGPYYAWERPGPVRLWFGNPDHVDLSTLVPGRASVAALVFGPDDVEPAAPEPGSFVWPRVGIGVLRSPLVRVAMRFGPDAGGHDHRDKLAVDVETRTGWTSLDLGTTGYGSAFTTWLRSPGAHNLIVVDGSPQPPHAGRLLRSSETTLQAESTWEGHRFVRTIELTDDGWSDRYEVALDHDADLEWIFHGDGRFLLDRWDWPGSPYLRLDLPPGFELSADTAGGNPNGRPLGIAVASGRARHAVFTARFQLQ